MSYEEKLTGCCPKPFATMRTIELISDGISLLTPENGFQQGFKFKNDIDVFANASIDRNMFLKEGPFCLG